MSSRLDDTTKQFVRRHVWVQRTLIFVFIWKNAWRKTGDRRKKPFHVWNRKEKLEIHLHFSMFETLFGKKKSGVTFSFFTRETEGNFRGNFCFLVNKFFFCQAQTFIFHNLSKKNSPEMWNFSCVSVLEPRPPNAEPSYYMRPSDRRTVA